MITDEILWSLTLTFLYPFFNCSFIHIFLFFVGTFVRPYFHSFVSTLVHSSIIFLNCLYDSSFDPNFAPSSVSSLIPPSFHPFLCTSHRLFSSFFVKQVGKCFFKEKLILSFSSLLQLRFKIQVSSESCRANRLSSK